MVMEFLFASMVATGITFHEEIGRASANKLPTEMSAERIGIQKELFDKAKEAHSSENYKSAITILNRLIKLDQYYPYYYYFYLGSSYFNLGRIDKALQNYHHVIECEGRVYVTTEPFINSVLQLINQIETEYNRILEETSKKNVKTNSVRKSGTHRRKKTSS